MTPLGAKRFDFDRDLLWIAHCAIGPVPEEAVAAVHAYQSKLARPWEVDWENDFLGIPQRVRALAARLLGGDADDWTIGSTTSSGLVTVAQGIDWNDGDEIVVPLGEFPSNYWPWRALASRGVRLRQIPLWPGHLAGREAADSLAPDADSAPEEALASAIGPRTRLVATSWVRFQDGLRIDVARLAGLCRAAQAELVVDGIQGAGTLPVPVEGIAAFATGVHKGLLSPQGVGLLRTSRTFRSSLAPSGTWLSVEDAESFDRPSTDYDRGWLPGGRRFELGVPNLVGCAALAASLQLLCDAGPDGIAAHVERLQRITLERLARSESWQSEAERLNALLDCGRLGSILSLHDAGEVGVRRQEKRVEEGLATGIHASAREGYFRIAYHGWHREEDAERVADWLTR